MAHAQTIQIYLPSGDPAGIRVASLTTRTVRVFEIPRSLLSDFLKRPEAAQVGVYYLFGSDGGETSRCYVGQTGNVGTRLKQHTTSKDFWTKAMVAVSLTNEWTTTHVAYLEWLSIRQADAAGRYVLENRDAGSNPHTPEPLEADCREFLETIAVLLATLGTPVLEPVQRPPSHETEGEPDPELLYFKASGCDATGYQTAEGLLILAGSKGRPDLLPSAGASIRQRRDWLNTEGVARLENGHLVFLKDYPFDSPSHASSVLAGRNDNGRISWKNSAGHNLNQIEAQALAASDSEQPTSAGRS